MRAVVHLALHGLVPLGLALTVWRARWKSALAWLLAANLVDLDHLLASPVYDPNRCSIGTHPLHSPWAMAAFVLLGAHPRTRILGVGLLVHMALDLVDCAIMG